MDILPLPHNPTSDTAKAPYVCTERYDGLAFLTYPARKGRPEMVSPTFPPGAEFGMQEKAHPTPVAELESLYQTWLYFGLICEFLNINENSPGVPASIEGNKEEEMDAVYKFFTITNEDGEKVLTSRPIMIPELELWKWEGDEETRKARCRHLFGCLRIIHWMLQWLPVDFDLRIKYSIAALAEFFNFNLGTMMISSGWKDVQSYFGPWAAGFVTKDVQKQMRDNGWCPSAIEETKTRFGGLQTMNLVCKMGKLSPKRDHTRCSERMCVNYQIDESTYKPSHAEECCTCAMLEVDSDAITDILMASDTSLPLLKIIPGVTKEDLRIEIVPSSPHTSYVALSHIWADGLGNPFSNSLHRCQLSRIKDLIDQLDKSEQTDSTKSKTASLLWVDTLCCPAVHGPGKRTAIQKLRHVYQRADKVLVLDASLFSIISAPLHTSEIVIRAYSSPWMRRLWTLQEGALNKNLFFQFADHAISAQGMIDELKSIAWNQDSRYMHPFMDMEREHLSIRSFFHHPTSSKLAGKQLQTLEAALQTRSFSVASDEPLCIATLMALDVTAILALEGGENRMRQMWSMLAAKFGGIPASIVFYEDNCLEFAGWRWAPRSFSPRPGSQFDLNFRKLRWVSGGAQLGLPSPYGLKCHFPGFRLRTSSSEAKDRIRGIYRPSETPILFRDEDGVWYSLTKSNAPSPTSEDFYERLKELRISEGWPLRDSIEGGDCAVVLEKGMHARNGTERDAFRGILVKVTEKADIEHGVFVAERKMHCLVATLYAQEAMVQETFRRLWIRIREDELIVRLQDIEDEESVEYKVLLKDAMDKMKNMLNDELEANSEFNAAMPILYGENFDSGCLWMRMANWWEQENVGVRLQSDQSWCID